jgi:hypothetical protein
MIDINVDQPDVLIIVSNSIPKANFVLDISSTIGYNKVTSCVPGTTNPITNPLDYDNLVIDNIIQHISDKIDKNVAVAFMLPQVPAGSCGVAKERMEDKENLDCKDWFFCTKKLDEKEIYSKLIKD